MKNSLEQLGKLCAREQLAVLRDYPSLIPGLCAGGLAAEDAVAVAHNAALLYYAMRPEAKFSSPEEVLGRFSLEEIAELCALQDRIQRGELECGGEGGAE